MKEPVRIRITFKRMRVRIPLYTVIYDLDPIFNFDAYPIRIMRLHCSI